MCNKARMHRQYPSQFQFFVMRYLLLMQKKAMRAHGLKIVNDEMMTATLSGCRRRIKAVFPEALLGGHAVVVPAIAGIELVLHLLHFLRRPLGSLLGTFRHFLEHPGRRHVVLAAQPVFAVAVGALQGHQALAEQVELPPRLCSSVRLRGGHSLRGRG